MNMMFQSYALFPHMNVWENVAFGLKRDGVGKADIAQREKQKLSIMPAGLQQNMTTQDFADLLEYLASLKKPAN